MISWPAEREYKKKQSIINPLSPSSKVYDVKHSSNQHYKTLDTSAWVDLAFCVFVWKWKVYSYKRNE